LNIGAELIGQYILQTHNSKKSEDSLGEVEFPKATSGYATADNTARMTFSCTKVHGLDSVCDVSCRDATIAMYTSS